MSAALALVAAAAIAVPATLVHLDHEYGPLSGGSFGGFYSERDIVAGPRGISHISNVPGATAELISSLSNNGSHPVEVSSVDTTAVITNVRWSIYRVTPGASVDGAGTRWRSFPATIPANGTIRLLITIHRPAVCQGHRMTPGVGAFYSPDQVVHWHSLLSSHVTDVQYGSETGPTIQLC